MLTMLLGAVVLAAVFGNVAMLVANYNISKTRLIEKMEQVYRYTRRWTVTLVAVTLRCRSTPPLFARSRRLEAAGARRVASSLCLR